MNARRWALAAVLALGLLAQAAHAQVADTLGTSADSSVTVAPGQEPVRYERWDPIGDRQRRESARAAQDSIAFERRVRGAEHRASLVTHSLLWGGTGLMFVGAGLAGDPAGAILGLLPMASAGVVGPAAGWSYGGDGRRALKSLAAHTAYLIGPTVVMVLVTDPTRWREPENVDVVFPTLLTSFVVNSVLAYHENHTIERTLRAEQSGPHALVVPATTSDGDPALALQVRW